MEQSYRCGTHFTQAKSAASALLYVYQVKYNELKENNGATQREIEHRIRNDPRWSRAKLTDYIDIIVRTSGVYFHNDLYVNDPDISLLPTNVLLETFNGVVRTMAEKLTSDKIADAQITETDTMTMAEKLTSDKIADAQATKTDTNDVFKIYESWMFTGSTLILYQDPQKPGDDVMPLQKNLIRYMTRVRQDLHPVAGVGSSVSTVDDHVLVYPDAEERMLFATFLDLVANACQVVSTVTSTFAECIRYYSDIRKSNTLTKLRTSKTVTRVPLQELRTIDDNILLPHQILMKRALPSARADLSIDDQQ